MKNNSAFEKMTTDYQYMKESDRNPYTETQDQPDETAQLNIIDSNNDIDDKLSVESFASTAKVESTSFRATATFNRATLAQASWYYPTTSHYLDRDQV